MKKKKILLIDDEKDLGLLVSNFLSSRNHQVFIAHTIEDGMKILEEEKPDFLFLDNQLPDGLGWGKTEFILINYPQTRLSLISAMEVPKTSASSFQIIYKPSLREELARMFD